VQAEKVRFFEQIIHCNHNHLVLLGPIKISERVIGQDAAVEAIQRRATCRPILPNPSKPTVLPSSARPLKRGNCPWRVAAKAVGSCRASAKNQCQGQFPPPTPNSPQGYWSR